MSKLEGQNQPVHDAPVHSSQGEAGAAVQKDAGFSHVGDSSPNHAWSQMTGRNIGAGGDTKSAGEPANMHAGMRGGADAGHQSGAIDFSVAPDIYSGKGQDASIRSGVGASSASGLDGRPDASYSESLAPLNEGVAGKSAEANYRANNSPGDNVNYSAGDTNNRSNDNASYSANDKAIGALDSYREPYDPKQSKLDGSKFQQLTDQQYNSLSYDEISKVNLNNAINIENRFADLGERAPNFALRGGGDPQTKELAAGQTPSDPSGRHFAVAEGATTDPAIKTADFAANLTYAGGYSYQAGAQLHAFDKQSPAENIYKKENYKYAAAPFQPSTNAGEKVISATPDDFKHVGSYDFNELRHNPTETPSFPYTPEHEIAGRNANALKGMDRILSDYERQNAAYLQSRSEINEQRRAADPPAEQMARRAGELNINMNINIDAAGDNAQPGWWQRMSDSLKSWW